MTTLLVALVAAAVSLAAITYLLVTDEKRRRVFRMNGTTAKLPRARWAGWLAVLAPSVVLIWLGQISGFLVWCGVITVGAWLIVSRTPKIRADSRTNI